MSLFRASLAVVEAEDDNIRYRRLSVWRKLSFDEVASCGPSKAGLEIGYIRLKRFLGPWGNLYFILDEPTPRGMDLITFNAAPPRAATGEDERLHARLMTVGEVA